MKSSVIIRKKSVHDYKLFAVCPGGLEGVLKKELTALGLVIEGEFPGGIGFIGTLEAAYLACLSLRTASRVLLLLKEEQEVRSPERLYDAVVAIDWTKVFLPSATFAVAVTESHTQRPDFPVNLQFLALKAKDAIADSFRKQTGSRPNVDRHDPDVTIRLHLHNHTLKIYFDLSGPSLHERGYRLQTGAAPLKENLAAGLMLLAHWDELSKKKVPFYDPFCGSGTLLIEAAMIATKTAPGLCRERFGFNAWRDHQSSTYERVREKLKSAIITDPALIPEISGSDRESGAIQVAKKNAENAGFGKLIQLSVAAFEETKGGANAGLIVCNPPYGVRMNEEAALIPLYASIGSTFKHQYKGWQVAVITSSKKLMQSISLKPSEKFLLHNGNIETFFHLYTLF